MDNENTQLLQELITQTMDDVKELTRQVSEINMLLKSTVENNTSVTAKLLIRADRHRQELNELHEQVSDLKRSRTMIIRTLGVIGSILGTTLTAAIAIWIEKILK